MGGGLPIYPSLHAYTEPPWANLTITIMHKYNLFTLRSLSKLYAHVSRSGYIPLASYPFFRGGGREEGLRTIRNRFFTFWSNFRAMDGQFLIFGVPTPIGARGPNSCRARVFRRICSVPNILYLDSSEFHSKISPLRCTVKTKNVFLFNLITSFT